MRYLGIEPKRPRVGVFDFTCCEGCELQLVNKEETLVDFLNAIDVVNFREASTTARDDYQIAFIEGAVSRPDEVERLMKIRSHAGIVVALGTCAVFGGVHKLKNPFGAEEANREVYGDHAKVTMDVRPVREFIKVDFEIPGCPVNKAEVERVLQHLLMGLTYEYPVYPVCVECKQRFTSCVFEAGSLCLGSISRAGCNAPCPAGGLGCWGCRGPAADPNYKELVSLAKARGHSEREISERMSFFGAFEAVK